jgi:hypothetical protein
MTSSGPARRLRWIVGASAGAAALALVWFMAAGDSAPPALFGGAIGFERAQARQTIAALGYHEVISLKKHDDGSWRAGARKDGTHWQLRISPYGIVSAHLTPQLGIVLE